MDPYYVNHQLVIGDNEILEGCSTPFNTSEGAYYVTLEGISVAGDMLDIDPNAFGKTPGGKNGAMIDSGCHYTWLADTPYEELRKEVELLLTATLEKYDGNRTGRLCFIGTVSEDLVGFPVVGFHFAEGADLMLDTQKSMFHQVQPRVFCMAIEQSSAYGENYRHACVIGVMAQQNYNVGFDVAGNKLYFQRIACELLLI